MFESPAGFVIFLESPVSSEVVDKFLDLSDEVINLCCDHDSYSVSRQSDKQNPTVGKENCGPGKH